MSSTYNPTATFVDAHSSRDDDDLELNQQFPTTPYNNINNSNHLSPFTSQNLSNSASPSHTPGDSGYSNYQPSEFSEVEDPFFGVNFDDGVERVDSLPLALAGTKTLQTLLNRRPTDPSVRKSASATATHPAYPLSPTHSSNPNTPPPKGVIIDPKGNTTISQHELTTGLHNSRFQSINSLAPSHPAAVQLTPEQSGSSHTSAEEIEPSTMPNPKDSPPIMISEWGNQQPPRSHIYVASGPEYVETSDHTFGGELPPRAMEPTSILRDEDGGWASNQRTGQAGLDPDSRRDLLEAELPSLKDQAEQRRIDHKNIEVEEWRSQAGDEQPSQSYFPAYNEYGFEQAGTRTRPNPGEDTPNIAPLDDDAASVHENRLVEGQTYFNFNNPQMSEADRNLIMQPRHWNDAPSYPSATATNFQPATANEAMMRFCRNADTISIASRAATWGTRRRSEPSLADWEGVADGSFLKKLSISKPSGRSRKDSFFDQGLDRLANIMPNMVRKRSDARLKRARSSVNIPEEGPAPPNPRQNTQGSLAPPSRSLSLGKKQSTPSINTTIAAMAGPLAAVGATHTRNGSISAITSPKSPGHLGFANRIINRARSKSDLSVPNDSGLAGLWRVNGGPPVATLATPQAQPEVKKPTVQKPKKRQVDLDDDDDDDDDDQEDEGDMRIEAEVDPIVPNYEGFKAHVRRLNPDMEARYNWLVSRIAHQQEIRYKNLLDLRVKHSQAINARNCSAGSCCLSLGGTVTLTDAKGNPRDSSRKALGLQLVTDFSDNDSNPGEGALTDETFPPGVPMPPTRNLPAEFECQLCFKAKKFQKPSDWTKHVHEDVQPFTCTYDKCKEPKSFKRKADWVRHENERHRHLEWWICDVDDCRHPCYRKDNFLQHLVREHKLPEPVLKTKAAIKNARTTEPAWIRLEKCHYETQNRPQDEPCKFCGKSFPTWKKLTVHLAKHMEHISLPILRLVELKNVDANTIISPVEQILTPVTPVGRAKMESASPFNMDSISPHMPMTNQFPSNGFHEPQYFQTSGPSGPYGLQTPMQQDVQYGQDLYQNPFGVQQVDQPRAFGSLDSGSMGMGQPRGFSHMNNVYTHPKVEQTRAFGSLDSGFPHGMPVQNFNTQQTSPYSMPQPFSGPPAVSGFQSPDVLGISDAGFDFDPMAVNGAQFPHNTPMSRAQGSASSYGHSPHHTPYYGP
jgi:hypothetical protein